MKQLYSIRILLAAALLLTAASCVDSTYDLNNISLKVTLGPNGVTLPLGKVDSLTVDSLIRSSDIKDMVVEDGFLAYKIDSMIEEKIDAIRINPIRDVIPTLNPYRFTFAGATLPQSFTVNGFTSNVSVALPSLDFTQQQVGSGVHKTHDLDISSLVNNTLPENDELPVLRYQATADFDLSLNNIPEEIKSIQKVYFSGADAGTPIQARLSLGSLASSVKEGLVSITMQLPEEYTLSTGQAIHSNRISVSRRFSGSDILITLYIVSRNMPEGITNQSINLSDEISYSVSYAGVSNGQPIQTTTPPVFTLDINPQINDAEITTTDINQRPPVNTTHIVTEIDNLNGINEVNYIAFTSAASNAINLSASDPNIPFRGDVEVGIVFPLNYELGDAPGLSNHVLTTTLDKLVSGIRIPIKGIRLSGSEAKVVDGKLSVSRPITTEVIASFPSGNYKLSELGSSGNVAVEVRANNMNLTLDAAECQIKAGFSEAVEINQVIDQTFEVPNEVGKIDLAQVFNADTKGEATFTLSLDILDSPVSDCYFDNIDIILPKFLVAEHPKLNPQTNTIHIDRVEYTGRKITIARIVLKAIKDIPVTKGSNGKTASLKSAIRITTTVNVDGNSVIDGLDQTEITLLPGVTVSPLAISEVTGSVDIDLTKHLKPTTIDLKDLRESLGDQDVEINLIAPQVLLEVSNPVGVAMVGDIRLQPYDFSGNKLETIFIRDITVEPAVGNEAKITKLFVTDGNKAPEGYTLCRVDNLAKLVRIIPSKIDVIFDLLIDKKREQSFVITGQDYPLTVDYAIKIPLKFTDGAKIAYSGSSDVAETFNDLDQYDITADDILLSVDALTTIPLDLDVTLDLLDAKGTAVEGVKATVLGSIKGYNAQSDGEYKRSAVEVLLDVRDGNIDLLTQVATIRYTIAGNAVGTEAGLQPDQYITADMKLTLKKGITIDLDKI